MNKFVMELSYRLDALLCKNSNAHFSSHDLFEIGDVSERNDDRRNKS